MDSSSSSSSTSPRTWRYNVFTSFHGPDVRKTFLSHLRKQFSCNGISMFDDQRIERGHTISPALTQAIRESRISIVVLSRNYASSGWCLDELVEIFKCKEDIGQIVMTVFYGVDPSDVRKQTGEFGIAFRENCAGKSEEERRRWSQALNDVGNIAGEHFLNWDNEAEMIEKIAKDVLDKLNVTPSKDFDGMVGLEAHLREMQSMLDLDYDGVKVVAITGPAGIGKTTIAKALQSRLSSKFPLTCFVDNLRGRSHSGFDEHGLKLRLQEYFLSTILNHKDMRISHLGAVKENLSGQKVLIILDDVNNLNQLEALANETTWFGPGSRIIVTTEDQELLQQHEIKNIYHVRFPSDEEALEILCRDAFRQSSPLYGFKEFCVRVTELCGKLPLALHVVGSSLRGKKEGEWEDVANRLETILGQDIEKKLRVGFESLDENEQTLFLHIAVFFNSEKVDLVKAMFVEGEFDVKRGLKILVNRSLIEISTIYGERIEMHKLLRQMARQVVKRQEPLKRQILMDAHKICDVLENETDCTSLMSISLDISTISDVVNISATAFRRMRNLRFLRVYETRRDINVRVVVPDDMNFPPRLRLLHWEVYPRKCLPCTFRPEYLVELNLGNSRLEKLWQGTQPLTNLKKMDLSGSSSLTEVPDLSNATNLKKLDLTGCRSLVEIPSSIGDLQKLEELEMNLCISLQVVPTQLNLPSLEALRMVGCWQLRKTPDVSTNIKSLVIGDTMLEDFPESIRLWPRLQKLNIYGSVISARLLEITNQSHSSLSTIERIPDWIKDLHVLNYLYIAGCPKLASLPELPRSLRKLTVDNCESLETVCFPSDTPTHFLYFPNCFRLSPEARRVIAKQSYRAYFPGKEIPAEFDHRAIGDSLVIGPSLCKFRICLVLSPKPEMEEAYFKLLIRMRTNGCLSDEDVLKTDLPIIQAEHLFIFFCEFLEQRDDVLFKFSTSSREVDVIECGVQVLTADETNESYESCSEQVSEDGDESLSDKSNEFDKPRVKITKGYTVLCFFLWFLLFLLSLISSVVLHSFLNKH